MEELSDPVVIGVVIAPHGVRGTIRVRATGSGVHLVAGTEPLVNGSRSLILRARSTPKGFLVDLDGVGDRQDAEKLRGKELLLDRSELNEPEDGEFYVDDLTGLAAVNESGESLGIVAETFETPAHEVLVVRPGQTGAEQEFYVPFTLEHVPEVDPESGHIVVRPPEPAE